jgi:5-(carboxyamino)imidazole ribonucleotide synthase
MPDKTILPGSTIGILGGGQLGRMLAQAAEQLGYHVIGYTPEANSPLSQVCEKTFCASFEDKDKLQEFAKAVDVITIEFENIPSSAIEQIENIAPVRPAKNVLYITQNRLREKQFLHKNKFPIVPFGEIASEENIETVLPKFQLPAVLKTAGFGYDGKGQAKIETIKEAHIAYKKIGAKEAIIEQFISFDKEISVIGARSTDGSFAAFGPIENQHKNHILDVSVVPANTSAEIQNQAINITKSIMENLDVIGLLCVEFFLVGKDKLYVNELAPRPHNSGHLTLNACITSQFEQHIKAITGLPLGDTSIIRSSAMANLLGDIWSKRTPKWTNALSNKDIHLYLYGKSEARPGRKMGHLTACAATAEKAYELAIKARHSLSE